MEIGARISCGEPQEKQSKTQRPLTCVNFEVTIRTEGNMDIREKRFRKDLKGIHQAYIPTPEDGETRITIDGNFTLEQLIQIALAFQRLQTLPVPTRRKH